MGVGVGVGVCGCGCGCVCDLQLECVWGCVVAWVYALYVWMASTNSTRLKLKPETEAKTNKD